jgi:hypothetical protein
MLLPVREADNRFRRVFDFTHTRLCPRLPPPATERAQKIIFARASF